MNKSGKNEVIVRAGKPVRQNYYPEGSSVYKDAENQLLLIDKNLHPEQIAAAKALSDFYAEGKKYEPEYNKIIKEHAERKKKLGLKDELD